MSLRSTSVLRLWVNKHTLQLLSQEKVRTCQRIDAPFQLLHSLDREQIPSFLFLLLFKRVLHLS